MDEFEYVIVGCGAAGSLLAARLSEDPGVSVCVLEAGPKDTHPFIHVPAGFIKTLKDPGVTWQFSTEPTANTGGRRIPTIQGRTLGGSSSVNGMIYNRGQPNDLDSWARAFLDDLDRVTGDEQAWPARPIAGPGSREQA